MHVSMFTCRYVRKYMLTMAMSSPPYVVCTHLVSSESVVQGRLVPEGFSAVVTRDMQILQHGWVPMHSRYIRTLCNGGNNI